MEDTKNVQNKKNTKIVSTIILLILLVISLIFLILILSFDVKAMIQEINANNESQEAAEQVAEGFAVALGAAIMLVLMIALSAIEIIVNTLCLIKSIFNRKSDVKWVKILSYVLDASFGLIILLTIIRAITWFV